MTSEAEELSGILCSLFILLLVRSRTALPNAVCSEEPASPRMTGAMPATVHMASLLAAQEHKLGGLLFREAGGLQAGTSERGIAPLPRWAGVFLTAVLKRAVRSIAGLCSPTALMGFSACPLEGRAVGS